MPFENQTTAAGDVRDPDWAWAPYKPSSDRPWTLARAGHLLRRAGFGATWDELSQALDEGPQRTISRLVSPGEGVASFNRTFDDYESAAATDSAAALRPWWLRRMIETPFPLLEKMTLFWHDFFAVSAARLPNAQLMRRHIQLLRGGAFGQFADLLQGVARDGATLLALGADANRKASPNENFARQLLERYTVGPENCSAADTREAARAQTGVFVLRSQLRYFDREHDPSAKTVLGQTGNFTAEDVIRIAVSHPATARNLVRRLFRWLISETEQPSGTLIDPLASQFAKDLDVASLVETMLRSNLFFCPTAYRRRIKRPTEFAVGIIRAFEGTVPTVRLANDLVELGENLYYPPTINGWAGGRHWFNPATLINRTNLAAELIADAGPYGGKLDPATVAGRQNRSTPESTGRFLVDLLLQPEEGSGIDEHLLKNVPTSGPPVNRAREFAHLVVSLPQFQLA